MRARASPQIRFKPCIISVFKETSHCFSKILECIETHYFSLIMIGFFSQQCLEPTQVPTPQNILDFWKDGNKY